MSFDLEIAEHPSARDAEFLHQRLTDFNRFHAGDDKHRFLAVFCRDESGDLIGGLLGDTYWEWLGIRILWVAEGQRHRGLGQALLEAAEQEALRRGCRRVHLSTHSFQALEFYQKRGYVIAGQLEDLPPGHSRYLLKKESQEE